MSIIIEAHDRAHTTSNFKHIHFLKLVDLYQLQVNKCVLSFLNGLVPSSLKHIFTLLQNQKWPQHQTIDSLQINGA